MRPGDFKYELYPRITTPMMPGVGYWLKVTQDVTLQVQGTPLSEGELYQVPLMGGWNQVGNPYARDLPVSEIGASLGTEGVVDLATAGQRQWLDATVWIWDAQQRRYQIAQTVQQWQGFWIRALRPRRSARLRQRPKTNGQVGKWASRQGANPSRSHAVPSPRAPHPFGAFNCR
jgi:hypothetical protein